MSVSFDPKFIKFGTTASNSLLTSLLAYWKCDESSGALADASGNSNNLNVVGGSPTYNQAGKINKSVLINTDADVFSKASSTTIRPSADVWSFSCWVKWVTLPSVGTYTQDIFMINDSTTGNGYAIRVCATSDNAIHLQVYNASLTQQQWYTGSSTFTDTNWHHVVCIIKGNGLNAEIWFDGVEENISTLNQSGNIVSANGETVLANRVSATPDEAFLGYITEAGVWNKALTSTEVASLYNSNSGRTYPFS
jgi:hypothetical protein